MGYERDEYMRRQEAEHDMIRMREPISKRTAPSEDATITALRDRVAEVERERDEAEHARDEWKRVCGDWQQSSLDNSQRATAAEAAIARLRDEVIEALCKARVYVEMIVTDQFADTGTDKQDLAEIDATLRALKSNRDTHHETR